MSKQALILVEDAAVEPNLFESANIPGPLAEAIGWGEPVDVTEFLRDAPGFDYEWTTCGQSAATQIDDRFDGRYVPVYRHEIDLKIIRAMSWLMFERVPMAKAWVERLRDYTIGTGFDWTITAPGGDTLAKHCKRLVDRVLADNDWSSELERETYDREVIDGESLLQIEMHAGGSVELMTRECDELTQPANARQLEECFGLDGYVSSWSFGVQTRQHVTHRPIGYHFVRDPLGADWDYVPASRVCHWKRNVRRNAKRGFGDFYTPHLYLGKGDKVFKNTAAGVAVQAAIAYIVEHAPGTTQKQANSMAGMRKLTGSYDSLSQSYPKYSVMKPGTRIDVRNGQKYTAGPLGTNNSKIYVEVMAAAIRLAGTVKAFPEGMLTGDYRNNNYASALVAQSPFVQGRIAEQNERAARFRRMILKILGVLADDGALAECGIASASELAGNIDVKITPPKVVPDDRKAMAEALAIEKAQGWVSDKTAMQELGRDADAERANGLNPASPAPVDPTASPAVPDASQATPEPQATESPAPTPVAHDGAPVEDVQTTGLNGAQMSGMLEIMDKVRLEGLPIASAKAAMSVAFPLLTDQQIAALIDPLKDAPPPPQATPPAPAQAAQAQPAPPVAEGLTESQQRIVNAWRAYP